METRKVSEHICLSELPFVMRAIGFYPSEGKVGRGKTSAGRMCYLLKKRPQGAVIIGQSKNLTPFLHKWIRKEVLGIAEALLRNRLPVKIPLSGGFLARV